MKVLKKSASLVLTAVLMCSASFAQEISNENTENIESSAVIDAAIEKEPVAQAPAADGMNTLFSQVFTGKAFKKIEIVLNGEDFVLVSAGADAAGLEIKSNVNDSIPLVSNDGKTLKITQKEKKDETQGRHCVVKLTLPEKLSPSDFSITLTGGSANIGAFGGTNVKIAATDANVTISKVKADKTLNITLGNGIWNIGQLETQSLVAAGKSGTFSVKKGAVQDFSITLDSGNASVELLKPFTKSSSLEIGSGNIFVKVPSSTVFYSTVSAGKGNYRSELATDTKGPELKVKFGKGSINISAN